MRPIATMLFAAALALTACTGVRETEPDAEARERFDAKDAGAAVAQSARVDLVARAPAPMVAQQRAVFSRSSLASSMVLRTGQASIEVDSLERAVARVRQLAERIGGYLANTAMQTGRGQLRAATLEVKIPADRFDDGLGGLAGLGRLEAVKINAEDVGEGFTDVPARLTNAGRLETRLIHPLATRAGKLKDLLHVQHQLGRLAGELE